MHDKKQDRNWDELKKLGYEPESLELKKVGVAVVSFMVFTTACIALGGIVFGLMNKDAFSMKGPDRAFTVNAPKPPNPLLQSNITTRSDIRELRQNERKVLSNYGEVDAEHVKVPIDRAIDLVLEKDLVKSRPGSVVVKSQN